MVSLQNRSFSFQNPAIEDFVEEEKHVNYEAVKTSRRVRFVRSKNGKDFIVTSIVQEFWLPLSYYEKVIDNGMKSYDENDRVYPKVKP